MEFLLRYRILIIGTIAALFIGYIGMAFYKQVSQDYQQTKDFFKPIQQKK